MRTKDNFVTFEKQIDYMITCDGDSGDWEDALIESIEFDENTNTLTITQKGGNVQSAVLNMASILEWLYF
ncbi:hypothetical protein [Dysgonomonas termitidis]|uniref:Uncharacterized protein n=1 Tax=Dysgonomonas termitidis TaxID=1516126 RepID=A0ABV9KXW0_9BACT